MAHQLDPKSLLDFQQNYKIFEKKTCQWGEFTTKVSSECGKITTQECHRVEITTKQIQWSKTLSIEMKNHNKQGNGIFVIDRTGEITNQQKHIINDTRGLTGTKPTIQKYNQTYSILDDVKQEKNFKLHFSALQKTNSSQSNFEDYRNALSFVVWSRPDKWMAKRHAASTKVVKYMMRV